LEENKKNETDDVKMKVYEQNWGIKGTLNFKEMKGYNCDIISFSLLLLTISLSLFVLSLSSCIPELKRTEEMQHPIIQQTEGKVKIDSLRAEFLPSSLFT
jgi:hypothetical protein